MTNLDKEALYSIVLHPNDVFFEECRFLFNKNNLKKVVKKNSGKDTIRGEVLMTIKV